MSEFLPGCLSIISSYQANSIKSRRVISYLTLAKNVLRHSPLILRRTVLSTVLNHLSRTYRNMVLVY
ncbi:transposase of Tn10 [Shigella boydii ATCC 9905]|nr:transposase of Tn10 [Shigella boydii ATCC 9905]